MGYGICISCQNCDYSEQFALGIGEMSSSLENIQEQPHYTKHPEVKEILNNFDVKDTDYAHELYHCHSCHSLYERFRVRIVYDDDRIYETAYACSKCGKLLNRIKEEGVPKLPCCSCGRCALKVDVAFCWD